MSKQFLNLLRFSKSIQVQNYRSKYKYPNDRSNKYPKDRFKWTGVKVQVYRKRSKIEGSKNIGPTVQVQKYSKVQVQRGRPKAKVQVLQVQINRSKALGAN